MRWLLRLDGVAHLRDPTHHYRFNKQLVRDATFDDVRYQYDDFYPQAADSGLNVPYVVSEASVAGSALPSTADWMFTPYTHASQTKFGSTLYDTYHAGAYYMNGACPPYTVIPLGYQMFNAANDSGSCVSQGTALW